MIVQRFARFQSNLGNLRISKDICYVRMTDNNDFLTIYEHRANLLNNNKQDSKNYIHKKQKKGGRGLRETYMLFSKVQQRINSPPFLPVLLDSTPSILQP